MKYFVTINFENITKSNNSSIVAVAEQWGLLTPSGNLVKSNLVQLPNLKIIWYNLCGKKKLALRSTSRKVIEKLLQKFHRENGTRKLLHYSFKIEKIYPV